MDYKYNNLGVSDTRMEIVVRNKHFPYHDKKYSASKNYPGELFTEWINQQLKFLVVCLLLSLLYARLTLRQQLTNHLSNQRNVY